MRSVQYLTSTVDPVEISRFLQTEMPIRYAERIRSLEHAARMRSMERAQVRVAEDDSRRGR